MKKILLPLMCVLLVCSCSVEQDTSRAHGELQVKLVNSTVLNRALIPAQDALSIASYTIIAHGPENSTVEIESESDEITLQNLLIGRWTIDATAYNAAGIPLVRGTITTLLSSQTNEATLNLDTLVGTGSLAVTATWNPDQVADDVSLVATLCDQSLTEVAVTTTLASTKESATISAADLPAGSYQLHLQLYSQETLISGAREAVRIIDGTESGETINLVIGDLSNTYTLAIVNNTALPIAGTIAVTPETINAGTEVTMVYTPELPADINETDLTITWYCEGEVVKTGSDTYVSIPNPGTHRYDVLVDSPKLGSLGSTSLLFRMPLATEGS